MRGQESIPNIHIGQVYDQRYREAEVHYESLARLAGFFGRNMPVHRHDRFFQLHYVDNGLVRVMLDDRHYCQPGPMFFLTPPTVPHAFITEGGSEGHVLTIEQQLVWPLLEARNGLVDGVQLAPLCVAVEAAEDVRRLGLLFAELQREFRSQLPGRQAGLQALTQLLLISLLRLAPRSLPAQDTRGDDLQVFRRFNLEVEARYLRHGPLADYAAALGITEARLNAVCRRVAGMSSKRLVFERLMQEAKRLLLFTDGSASEVGYRLGFKDPAYFSRFFSRHAGMTPGDYRLHRRGRAGDLPEQVPDQNSGRV